MRKTFTYRIYLTNGQRRILERQLEECRWVYNETLAERRRAYEERGVSLRLYDTQAMLPVWKAARPSLTRVHSQVLQDVQVRVDRAFQAFFRRVQAGEHPGYPRYKGKGRYDSITCPPYGNGVRLDGERPILSKVGTVHVVLHRPLEGTPKTVTIRRSATGKWYACISCVVDAKPLPPADAAVGIDMGLESFLVRSDGEQEPNPQFYRHDEEALKRAQQRKEDAKHRADWTAYRRCTRALATIHERIANRRADFAHKLSRAIVNSFQIIVVEKLAPSEMGRSRGMRKSIRDAAWSQFISMTRVKAEEAGRTVVLVDPAHTSQMCSSCGNRAPKTLSDRIHACPCCGLVMDRDHNTARNILHRGLQYLRSASAACGAAHAEAQVL